MAKGMRAWMRFEGPGKLHTRHWHIVKSYPTDRWATLCGIVVRDAQVRDEPEEGPKCALCETAAARVVGDYL